MEGTFDEIDEIVKGLYIRFGIEGNDAIKMAIDIQRNEILRSMSIDVEGINVELINLRKQLLNDPNELK